MRFFISIILVTLSFSAFGQNHFIGIKAGLKSTIATLEPDWENSFTKGFVGGLTYQYNIDQHFLFNGEFLYDERGYRSKTVFSHSIYPNEQDNETTYDYDYISLPLKFGYRTLGDFSGFLSVGVVPGYLIKAEHFYSWVIGTGLETDDVTQIIQRFDFAGVLEVGCSYSIKPYCIFSLSFEYQHSFNSVSQEGYFETANVKNSGFSLSGGIKYALQKN